MEETSRFTMGITNKNRERLYFKNKSYVKYKSRPSGMEYWKCSVTKCGGRLTRNCRIELLTVSKNHDCLTSALE